MVACETPDERCLADAGFPSHQDESALARCCRRQVLAEGNEILVSLEQRCHRAILCRKAARFKPGDGELLVAAGRCRSIARSVGEILRGVLDRVRDLLHSLSDDRDASEQAAAGNVGESDDRCGGGRNEHGTDER
jgi:hypothetical protein